MLCSCVCPDEETCYFYGCEWEDRRAGGRGQGWEMKCLLMDERREQRSGEVVSCLEKTSWVKVHQTRFRSSSVAVNIARGTVELHVGWSRVAARSWCLRGLKENVPVRACVKLKGSFLVPWATLKDLCVSVWLKERYKSIHKKTDNIMNTTDQRRFTVNQSTRTAVRT